MYVALPYLVIKGSCPRIFKCPIINMSTVLRKTANESIAKSLTGLVESILYTGRCDKYINHNIKTVFARTELDQSRINL